MIGAPNGGQCLLVTRIMQGDGVANFGIMQFKKKNKDEMAFKS